jgi:exosortase family protein XrtF
MWKEFKPAFRFLFIFLGAYLTGNVIYGLFIEAYYPAPDPVTYAVAHQTSWVLNVIGDPVSAIRNLNGPTIFIRNGANPGVNIFEGCNGLNVMIVFASFLFAFAGQRQRLIWFLPLGIVIIHLSNIVRMTLLYLVAVHHRNYFYYLHKYVFTAAIYLIVFLLWFIWVTKINGNKRVSSPV